MRILLSTPAFGGQVTCGYLKSLIPTLAHLSNDGHEVHIHMLESESLISRGRNTAATHAITQGYDKLMFIDADISFSYDKMKLLLESKEKIVGGSYPLKNYPITINFNPLADQRDLFGVDRSQDNYLAWVRKYAKTNGEAEVLHIPTGFMLIDCEVLAKLTHKVPWYQNYEPDTKEYKTFYDFFPVRVVDNQYQSEDWAFCELAREHGYKIVLQTKAICEHIGTRRFGLGQHEIVSGQEPII